MFYSTIYIPGIYNRMRYQSNELWWTSLEAFIVWLCGHHLWSVSTRTVIGNINRVFKHIGFSVIYNKVSNLHTMVQGWDITYASTYWRFWHLLTCFAIQRSGQMKFMFMCHWNFCEKESLPTVTIYWHNNLDLYSHMTLIFTSL